MSDDLDVNFIPKKQFSFRKSMQWWERRRKWYSLLIISIQVLVMFSLPEGVNYLGHEAVIVFSLFYLLAANICYCLGWGIEFLLSYYFETYKGSMTLRLLLFSLGVAFSALFTFFFYWDALWFNALP